MDYEGLGMSIHDKIISVAAEASMSACAVAALHWEDTKEILTAAAASRRVIARDSDGNPVWVVLVVVRLEELGGPLDANALERATRENVDPSHS